jgi:hypothetical protein
MRRIGTLEVDQNWPGTERRCSPGTISRRLQVPRQPPTRVDRQSAESAHRLRCKPLTDGIAAMLDGQVRLERVDVLMAEHRRVNLDRLGMDVVQILGRVSKNTAADDG